MDRAAAIFEQALGDLATRMGVGRESLSAAELLALARAAERVANPFREVNADAAGMPVRICEGWHLWKLTMGASVWLDECAGVWWADDADKYNKAFVFASVHAREPEAFADLDTPEKAHQAIRALLRRIPATPEEIAAAMDAALGLRAQHVDEAETARAAADWSAIVARIAGQTGIPMRELAWLTSAGMLIRTYNDLHAFAAAHVQGGHHEHMRDELDAAAENLQRIKVDIMKTKGKTE